MIALGKLKRESHICAYCNKTISMEERTIDHIIPDIQALQQKYQISLFAVRNAIK